MLNAFAFDCELSVECSADAEGKPVLPRFSMLAYSGGQMNVGGWRYPIVVDLAGLSIPAAKTVIRLGHEANVRIGHTESVEIKDGKLVATGVISATGEHAREVVADAKNGFPWQASIGARVIESEFIGEGKTVIANGRTFDGPMTVIRKAKLKEISFVDLGADENTSASVAAQLPVEEQQRQEETAVESEKPTNASVAQAAGVQAAAPEDTLKAQREIMAKETERVAAIRAACSGQHSAIEAQAIREGWNVEKTELAVIRANRQSNIPNIGVPQTDMSEKVCEAALCLKLNIANDKNLVASYGDKVLDQASKLRGVRFTDMARHICASNQINLPLDAGSGEWIKAAFSNAALSGILGAVANKALAAAATAQPYVAPLISGVASHSNFHTHTVYSMALNGDLQKVASSGELKHLNLSEESYTRQVDTRGAVLRITRKDIINDELGAFVSMAQALARKAFIAREKALFTIINATGAGASFFTAGNKNYMSGAATVLGVASIDAGIKLFRNQTGPDGDPILVEPEILMVPPSLEAEASRLLDPLSKLMASGLSSTSSKNLESDRNNYSGRFGGKPVVSPFLENANLTGYSTTGWYLLANPSVMPAFEIAYLNGVQTPTVEYFGIDASVDQLGAAWRIYYDFGVGTAEYRAGVKSKGAA